MLGGCGSDNNLTKQQWLELVNDKLAFVDDNYQQNLLAYNIIDNTDIAKLDQKLDDELVKKTLTNIVNQDLRELNIEIQDNLSDQKALKYLDICVNEVNNLTFNETKSNYELNNYIEDANIISQDYQDYSKKYQINDLIKIDNKFYIVKNIIANDTYNKVELEEATYQDIFKSMNLQSSFQVNFDNAEIIENDVETLSYANKIQTLGTFATSNQFQYQGFKIYYNLNGNSFHVTVSKDTLKGFDVYNTFDINNIFAHVNWDYSNKTINEAYFRLDYDITEAFGIKNQAYYDRFLDIATIKDQNSFNNFTSLFKSKQEMIETTVPIAQIKVPVPQCPIFNLTLSVNLHMYASGRIAISLQSSNQTGFEIKNNKFRLINTQNKDYDFIVKASGSATINLTAALKALNYNLTDFKVAVGIKGYVKSTVHLLDDDKQTQSISSDIPADLLDELAQNNQNVFVCADLSLYWIADITINTEKSLLSKLGYYHKISLLDEDNQVLNNLTHLENWHFVEKCSYEKGYSYDNIEEIILNSDQIRLQDYAILLRKNETAKIVIKALPKGYEVTDLNYEVADSKICVVQDGIVTGLKKGATTIRVKTSDNQYEATISVLIKNAS